MSEYVERLNSMDITLLTPFTKTKEKHDVQCNRCGHQWSTTPMAIFQSNKKNPARNGCTACVNQEKYGAQREAVLERFATEKPHLEFLTEYNGNQAFNGDNSKVRFRNTKCGHEFETYPRYLLSGRSKYDCTVCGANWREHE